MRRFRQLGAATLVATLLSGCATASFAPPDINLKRVTQYEGPNASTCSQRARSVDWKKATGKDNPEGVKGNMPENFDGAMALIDNFTLGYRCAAREAADGRPFFEVPAFLIGTTAIVGQALGVSEDATIALGAATLAARQGNTYLAPQAKADYLNSALDAVHCIQLEAVGIPGFSSTVLPTTEIRTSDDPKKRLDEAVGEIAKIAERLKISVENNDGGDGSMAVIKKLLQRDDLTPEERKRLGEIEQLLTSTIASESKVLNGLLQSKSGDDPTISTNAQKQYFRVISGALLSVERVLARRLNRAGREFDPSGVMAELELLNIEIRKNEDQNGGGDGAGQPPTDPNDKAAMGLWTAAKSDEVTLKVKEIRPEIQKCILLAKL